MPISAARVVISVSDDGERFARRTSIAEFVIEVNKFLQEQVIDEVDIFFERYVHDVFPLDDYV